MTRLHRLATAALPGVLLVLLLGMVGLQAGQGGMASAAAPPSAPALRSPMADPRAQQPLEPPSEAVPSNVPRDVQSELASALETAPASEVVELLRLQVPARFRPAWLEAERASWEPWLARQDGFLGRQLFWDPQREEGLLLIRWASRAQWKGIPPEAVGAVQERFEQHARRLTGSSTNPFPLLDEAELQPL
jgi:uncharacterized protein (TIGR03792 family)